jgi:rRNA processing protein Krr1/Pno1
MVSTSVVVKGKAAEIMSKGKNVNMARYAITMI